MGKFQARHYEFIAERFRTMPAQKAETVEWFAEWFADEFAKDNPNFSRARFLHASRRPNGPE